MTAMIEAGEAIGLVDLLVNNAGTFPRVPLLEMTDEQWSTVLEVNLASVAAYRGLAAGQPLCASKAGVVGFTRAASTELAPLGIRINAVAPGLTDTAQPRHGMSEEEIAKASGRVPLGAMATPSEIADVVVFLLSAGAGHITGQVLHVNGGSYFG